MEHVLIDRNTLWSIWGSLLTVPFELRDRRWELASSEVKKLLILTSKKHQEELAGNNLPSKYYE